VETEWGSFSTIESNVKTDRLFMEITDLVAEINSRSGPEVRTYIA